MNECLVDGSVRKCIKQHFRSCEQLVKGIYPPFLALWMEHFPPDQLLVLHTEEYAADERSHLEKVLPARTPAPGPTCGARVPAAGPAAGRGGAHLSLLPPPGPSCPTRRSCSSWAWRRRSPPRWTACWRWRATAGTRRARWRGAAGSARRCWRRRGSCWRTFTPPSSARRRRCCLSPAERAACSAARRCGARGASPPPAPPCHRSASGLLHSMCARLVLCGVSLQEKKQAGRLGHRRENPGRPGGNWWQKKTLCMLKRTVGGAGGGTQGGGQSRATALAPAAHARGSRSGRWRRA